MTTGLTAILVLPEIRAAFRADVYVVRRLPEFMAAAETDEELARVFPVPVAVRPGDAPRGCGWDTFSGALVVHDHLPP